MFPIPSNEQLVENKICKQCSISFPITDKDIEFYNRLGPAIGGEKITLTSPKKCPKCRKIDQLAWRNESKLYRRNCDASGKNIISHFPPDVSFKVYEENIWNSDSWNAKDYGRDFDFTKPFFEQFADLQKEIPRPATAKAPPIENADYCNNAGKMKDCYLCFNSQNLDKCYYCIDTWYSNHCIDCYCVYGSENCYECILTYDSYNINHSYDVKKSRDSSFLLSCEGCENCYGCYSLMNKKYHIYNTEYSKEEYKLKLDEILQLSLIKQKAKFKELYKNHYSNNTLPNIGSENVMQSTNVIGSKNVFGGRNLQNVEDVRYGSILFDVKLAMDYYVWGNQAEKIYGCHQVGNSVHSMYLSVSCWDGVHDIFYSYLCINGVSNCFGCIGLRNNESYCILNKQYTKEEYEKLVLRIIKHMQKTGEWGEFFPASLSPHGYNDSIANILSPLDKNNALSQGFNWSDYEAPFPKVEKIIPASKLPEDISQIPDDILNWAIECEVTKRPFRIIPQELEYYRKKKQPIPHLHPDQRQSERLQWHINY